jgi:hypothetical protein
MPVEAIIVTTPERDALFVQFSQDVDDLMREQNLTVPRLARRADVSEGTVERMLKGRPCHPHKMMAVLSALGAQLAFTVTRKPQPNNPTR